MRRRKVRCGIHSRIATEEKQRELLKVSQRRRPRNSTAPPQLRSGDAATPTAAAAVSQKPSPPSFKWPMHAPHAQNAKRKARCMQLDDMHVSTPGDSAMHEPGSHLDKRKSSGFTTPPPPSRPSMKRSAKTQSTKTQSQSNSPGAKSPTTPQKEDIAAPMSGAPTSIAKKPLNSKAGSSLRDDLKANAKSRASKLRGLPNCNSRSTVAYYHQEQRLSALPAVAQKAAAAAAAAAGAQTALNCSLQTLSLIHI